MRAQAQATAPNLKGSARLGSYLRQLRTGYGYSLRRVEQRARAEGGEIDNSQLSRYEKGICYPSFDKLRILASVFNVSVQAFSDVVDLEAFEDLKPETGDPDRLVADGICALKGGDTGLAFALFERATELLLEREDRDRAVEAIAQARVNQATALLRLGKLALAEQELRTALRDADLLSAEIRARALLALVNVLTEQGDFFLAEIHSERALALADSEGAPLLRARGLHALGFVLSQRGLHPAAIERYREAARLYDGLDERVESARVRINIGTCYVALGKHREGVRLLLSALEECRALGHRRLEARTWSNLGEAYFRLGDRRRARGCLRESDALASSDDNHHADIQFVNAFYEWKMAESDENPTREKIAFGRLKALRSQLEKRFPEVEAFDEYVERGRCHA